MNGRKVKEIKEKTHGDFSPKDVDYIRDIDGSFRCVGRRATYQKMKKNNRRESGGNKRLIKGKNRPRWLFPKKRDQ